VPTPNVSVVDLVIQVEKKTLAEEVNEAFRNAAANELNGILAVSDVPLVSRDFALTDVSTTIDSSLTMVMVRSPLACLIERIPEVDTPRL
jgi:glyceraldehyde-3-phosphate dehydrogenase (NADP+) (phosphorylating)